MTLVPLLDRPTYLYAEVDRLVGLRPGTAKRWINGYERAGKHYDPILRRSTKDTDWVTWGEFVEARMLADFRDASVPTTKLRAAVEGLRDIFGLEYPLAHLRPHVAAANGELAIDTQRLNPDEAGLMVIRTGQLILEASSAVIQTATLATDANGQKYAAELQADIEYSSIKLNPERMSGQPTFAGRRLAVAVIAGMVTAGEAREDLAADYGLSLAQVDEAVQYAKKHSLAA